MATEYLSQKHAEFQEVNIRTTPGAIRELQRLNVMATPALVFGDKVLVGFNPAEIDAALNVQAGEGKTEQ